MRKIATQRPSLPLLIAIVVGNLLGMLIGYLIEDHAFDWFGYSTVPTTAMYATTVMYLGYWVMIGSLSVLLLLCSWGPGAIWVRGLAMLMTSMLLWFFIYSEELFDSEGLPDFGVSYAPELVEVLVITVPLMLALSLVAAFGRWRIGPPTEQPIRVRIVDIMMGTAALALLFAATQGEDQSYNITFAIISTPIVTILVTSSAWTLVHRYAWLFLAATLVIVYIVLYLQDPEERLEYTILCFTVLAACGLIAINVWLLGVAGWPLSRRRQGSRSKEISTETPSEASSLDARPC